MPPKAKKPSKKPTVGQKRGRSESPVKKVPKSEGKAVARRDTDLPMTAEGVIYHLDCTKADIADRFIFVGDPGRVPKVAALFDKDSLRFENTHREICIMTGTYKGVPVTALSTGMGTDNCEIVMNELHALKEYDVTTGAWSKTKPDIGIIRVGTCGSPNPKCVVGTLAITQHAIGLDNTGQYYRTAKPQTGSEKRLADFVNKKTKLGTVGVYTSKASPDVTQALVKSAKSVSKRRGAQVGITCSCSGFYGCQGRCVGRFKGNITIPDLVDVLAEVSVPPATTGAKAKKEQEEAERVVNIEMETSAICHLSSILGYRSGAVCGVVAARDKDKRSFATPEEGASMIKDGIQVALDALVSL